MPHRETVEAGLRDAQLVPVRSVPIRAWARLARDLYRPTFGVAGSTLLSPGAEAWLTATRLLFGDAALLLLFGDQPDDASTLRCLERLDRFKRDFRDHQRPVREQLSIQCTVGGVTYPVVFNYVHTPEPSLDALRADWACLVRRATI